MLLTYYYLLAHFMAVVATMITWLLSQCKCSVLTRSSLVDHLLTKTRLHHRSLRPARRWSCVSWLSWYLWLTLGTVTQLRSIFLRLVMGFESICKTQVRSHCASLAHECIDRGTRVLLFHGQSPSTRVLSNGRPILHTPKVAICSVVLLLLQLPIATCLGGVPLP